MKGQDFNKLMEKLIRINAGLYWIEFTLSIILICMVIGTLVRFM